MSRSEAMMAEACEDYDEDCCAWSRREAARLKQIQIGKARPEYQRYVREVLPSRRTPSQPSTPDPRARVSKRQFDRALGEWRRRLHEFDAVPRGPPRAQGQVDAEVLWSSPGQQSSKTSWGSAVKKSGGGQLQQDACALGFGNGETGRNGPRSGNRRARATAVPPRAERSGKLGPRKPVDALEISTKDSTSQADPSLPPPPPPPPYSMQAAAEVSAMQQGVVRISLADRLADQLLEMPMQAMPQGMDYQCQYWYQGPEAWGSMETPQKQMMGIADIQFMQMETPADKPLMPGHAMCQMTNEDGTVKVDDVYGMPMETYMGNMLPHRLFDSSPEKSPMSSSILHEHQLEDSSPLGSEATTVQSSDQMADNEVKAPQSPRYTTQPDYNDDSVMPLMSPPLRCLASPTPTTPKRQCYVPETPSPDRMHCSWIQQPPTLPYAQSAPIAGLPHCFYGQSLAGLPHEQQVIPEFLPMLPCIAPNEGYC